MAKSLSRVIKDDPEYSTFLRIVKEARKALDYAEIQREATQLHESRVARTLYGKNKMSIVKIDEANSQDLAWRARLVAMRVRLYIKLSVIEEAIDAFVNFVIVQYVDDLKGDGFMTKDQRVSFMKNLLHKHHVFVREGKTTMQVLDWLIDDIDKGGYRIREMQDAVKIHQEAKSKGA